MRSIGKSTWNFRSCRFAVFLTVIETAVMDSNTDSRKRLQHIGRCDPVLRIFRVVIITVYGQTVGGDEVVSVAVVVFVFCAYIVMTDSILSDCPYS
jgi:hypothetical protein